MVDDPEEVRRRIVQTRFLTGEGTQQTTLQGGPGERGVFVAGPPPRVPHVARPPPSLPSPPMLPRRTLLEFGGPVHPVFRPAASFPAPPAQAAPPQQVFFPVAAPPTPEREQFLVLPPELTTGWHLPVPELRDYQQQAVDAVVRDRHLSVVLPTGLGKTLVAVAAVLRLRVPTVVLVPTLVLLTQWRDEFTKAGIRTGAWYGEEKEPSWITLSTYQSLYDSPHLLARYPFIVFDEGDLATAETFRRLIDEAIRHPYALLMTATVPRDADRLAMMQRVLPIRVERTIGESVEAGHFVPIRVAPMGIALDGEESARYDRADMTIRQVVSRLGTADPRRIVAYTRSSSQELRSLAYAYLKAVNERKAVLSGAVAKPPALLQIVQRHPGERVLVFSESVEAVNAACAYLSEHGVPCRTITGETPTTAREDTLHNWGVTFYVLGSVSVLTRGFNVPQVATAVILASGMGATQLTQRIGRIVRTVPGKTQATVYVVYARGTTEERLPGRIQELVR